MANQTVTGQRPPAEGWTTHIPASLRRMRLSEYAARGRSKVVTPLSLEEGSGFSVKPRQTKADREMQKSRETLRARFDRHGINSASLNQQLLDTAIYDYAFDPVDSTMISKLEYSSKSRLLRVTFANNEAVVTYGGVPMNAFARLQYVESSGNSVGGAFWDVVRIYDRRALPVGGPYYPKTSNFVREGSKFPFIYQDEGSSLGERASKYAPTIQHEKYAEVLTQEIITGTDAEGNQLTPDQIKERVKKIKKLKDGDISADMLARIERQFQAEASPAQRQRELEDIMGAESRLGAEIWSEEGPGGFHVSTGSAKAGVGDLISQLEKLEQNKDDPNYASKRAALYKRLLKQQEFDLD